MDRLSEKQQQALEAYRRGFISIGKLSEIMGRTILQVRDWLNEHNISQNNSFLKEDFKNAS